MIVSNVLNVGLRKNLTAVECVLIIAFCLVETFVPAVFGYIGSYVWFLHQFLQSLVLLGTTEFSSFGSIGSYVWILH